MLTLFLRRKSSPPLTLSQNAVVSIEATSYNVTFKGRCWSPTAPQIRASVSTSGCQRRRLHGRRSEINCDNGRHDEYCVRMSSIKQTDGRTDSETVARAHERERDRVGAGMFARWAERRQKPPAANERRNRRRCGEFVDDVCLMRGIVITSSIYSRSSSGCSC